MIIQEFNNQTITFMAKTSSESPTFQAHNSRQPHNKIPSSSKFCVFLICLFALIFILFQIQALQTPSPSSLPFMHQKPSTNINHSQEIDSMASKLRESVAFLPLKDLRYAAKPQEGHTWFMSSLMDTHEKGEVQYQEYPSKASKGRMLCLKGRDTHDGSWNSYALAWPQFLPPNASLITDLTFVSYNHYNYDNIWHGLSAAVPFVAWHIKNKCRSSPIRWVLYHWGELRTRMGPWLSPLMEAIFNQPINIENFESRNGSNTLCFQKSVIRMTMLMRTGPRSFRNQSAVIGIFNQTCRKVDGCHLTTSYSNNLSFCEQVNLMKSTDILVSPHGAQLTNMFLMDRNSSVLEFFPKGWLKLAGIGQYVYHWIASWSGMNHRGAWRDPDGDPCQFPEDDRRCMSVFKNAKIGHSERYFSDWAEIVLNDVRSSKAKAISNRTEMVPVSRTCSC